MTVVDAFLDAIRDTFRGVSEPPVRSDDVHGKEFPETDDPGYDQKQVNAFLEAAGIRLAAMESMDRPVGPLVSSAILADWADWADSTRFSTRRLREGYDKREIDVFRGAVRDTFLGVKSMISLQPSEKKALSQPPVRSDDVRGKQFSTHRPGYDKKEVDAFLDAASIRLAAMESTDRPEGPLASGTFSPMGRVSRLNKIFNRRDGPSGPRGPTQQDFNRPPQRGATRRRRSTRSGKRFATRSSG